MRYSEACSLVVLLVTTVILFSRKLKKVRESSRKFEKVGESMTKVWKSRKMCERCRKRYGKVWKGTKIIGKDIEKY